MLDTDLCSIEIVIAESEKSQSYYIIECKKNTFRWDPQNPDLYGKIQQWEHCVTKDRLPNISCNKIPIHVMMKLI